MRIRSWAVAAAAVAVAFMPAWAAAQAKPAAPTVEVRVRSVDDLLDRAEYIAALVDKEDQIKQVKDFVKNLGEEGKGVEGLDTKRPIGAYAVVTADVATSPVVVMIPVASEERLLKAFSERLGVVPEKAEGGTLKAHVPLIDVVYLRFANDYLYAARDPKHLDPKTLALPKTFFPKDDAAVATVLVRFDTIPADVKTFVVGQLEHQAQEGLKKDADTDTAAQKKLKAVVTDGFVGSVKQVVEDGKDLTVGLFIDPKTDELYAETTLTGKAGTTLAKNIAGWSGRTSLPAGIVATKEPAVKGATKAALTPDLRKRLDPVIDGLIEDLLKQAKDNDREAAKRVLTTLTPTFKAGEFDGAFTLSGADAKGKHTLLAAVVVKDGKEIEKLVKDFAAFIPEDKGVFTFDTDKVGDFAVHKVVLKGDENADMDRVFGTRTVWLATSEDCVALSIEADGAALKAGLKAKAAAVPVFGLETALAKSLPVFNSTLKPDEVKALIKDAFGGASPAGKDTFALTVAGGDKLTARLTMKGKAFRLTNMLEEFKKK